MVSVCSSMRVRMCVECDMVVYLSLANAIVKAKPTSNDPSDRQWIRKRHAHVDVVKLVRLAGGWDQWHIVVDKGLQLCACVCPQRNTTN